MNLNSATVMLLSLSSFLIFQGCSESQFNAIDSAEKLSTLENHSGLGSDDVDNLSNNGDNGLNSPTQNTNDTGSNSTQNQMGGLVNLGGVLMPILQQNDNGNSPTPPKQNDMGANTNPNNQNPTVLIDKNPKNTFNVGNDPITNPTLGRFNVIRWCRGKNKGATLKTAKDVQITVRDKTKNTIQCQATGPQLLNQIMSSGQVDIPNCNFTNISNKNIVVEVKNEKGQSLSDGTDSAESYNSFDDDKVNSDDNRKSYTAVAIHLLMDRDIEKLDAGDCDAYNSSPLVVDMRSNRELKQLFELSEPSVGVDFDILGLNSYPSPHTTKRISWFKDPRIMPIVLPNNGYVDGINELFGDNTLGPDNKFSKNGFAALAKYDGLKLSNMNQGKRDGYINKKDEIYFKLKVWYDRNLNGVAEKNELYGLQQSGIEVIDLKFDPNYYSQDKYGNEIKYKSVVKLKSGELKPVFDIWFTVNNLIQK